MQRVWQLRGVVALVATIAAIEILARAGLRIPNPPALLLLCVVYAAFSGGMSAGLVSAGGAWIYFASFFSIPGQPFHYTAENLGRVLVWALTTPTLAVMVGTLKRRSDRVFEEMLQLKLRNRDAGFRLLFANNPHPMWVYDVESLEFLEVNDAAVEGYGYTRDEFLRMKITDVRPPEDVPRLMEVVASYSDGDAGGVRRHKGTWRHRLKDGRVRDVDVVSHTLEFTGRRAALVVAIDVTELRQTEASLWTYTERLKILHEIDAAIITAQAPVAISEAVLRPLRNLLGVPRAIVNLFDLEAGEAEWLAAIGQHRTHLGPGVRFPLRLMGDVESLRRGELQVVDVDTLPRDRHVEALLASGVHVYMVVPMIAWDELIGGLSFGGTPRVFSPEQIQIAQEVAAQLAIAIAQARLHERVKRQAEELEQRVHERTGALSEANARLEREIADRRRAQSDADRANRAKSEFLSSMSHELRTPLNGIIGFAELMHDGRLGPISAEQQEYMGDILRSARHLLQLINDVLDLAKVESGKMEFRPQRVAVTRLVREVRDILRTQAAQKRIRVEIDIDPAVDEVTLDPAKLKQVLYNYLSNALKFTPDEGQVTIRVAPESSQWFTLAVEDTGIGIQPDDLDRLFTAFQQLDGSIAKKHPGTGLGLALTKRIVDAQGGRVGARSAPGKGSVFSAVLPRVARMGTPRDTATADSTVVVTGGVSEERRDD